MADTYFEDATHKTSLDGDEAIGATSDPAGTPADVHFTPDDILAYIATAIKTLTNKRITKRVVGITVSATPAINTDSGDTFVAATAFTLDITSMTTNLTGTPTNGQQMIIELIDNGTARAITWGASFASGPATLPTTTIISKWLYVGFEWSASRSKWICMAAGSEQ